MNRLSFLKTLGVGIAAAVIVPKIIGADGIPYTEEVLKTPLKTGGIIPHLAEKGKEYGHYHEDFKFLPVEALRIHDSVIDKDQRMWICTGLAGLTGESFNHIHLTALDSEPEPNYLEVERESFDEYFLIVGNMYSIGIGGPR